MDEAIQSSLQQTSYLLFFFETLVYVFFFLSSLICREEDELDFAKAMGQGIAFRVSHTCFSLMSVFVKCSELHTKFQ